MQHLGDITKISGYTAPIVDCIIGGSPCQDLSVAGKRAGLDGERSGLFMEQVRIAKEMRKRDEHNGRTGVDIRPRYMVWENVAGAFSSNKGEDFRIVLEEIAKVTDEDAVIPMPEKGRWTTCGCIVGDGWSIAWRVLDAQFWGVPQRRRRIALVADFGGESASEILFVRKSVSRDIEQSKPKGKESSSDATRGVGADDCLGVDIFNTALTGDKACPLTAEGHTSTGTCPKVMTPYTMQDREGKAGGGKGALIAKDLSATLRAGFAQTLFQPVYSVENHPNDSRVKIDNEGKVQALTSRMGTGAVCYGINGDTAGTLDSSYYKGCGMRSGVEREVVAQAVDCRNCTKDDTNGALQSNSAHSLNGNNVVRTHYIVRRLTPLECERLQGYPDGWTQIGEVVGYDRQVDEQTGEEYVQAIYEYIDDNGKKRKTSDAARYKALGNSPRGSGYSRGSVPATRGMLLWRVYSLGLGDSIYFGLNSTEWEVSFGNRKLKTSPLRSVRDISVTRKRGRKEISMSSLIDLTDKRFGRLTVIRREANSKKGQARWLCKCDCGNDTIVLGTELRRGHTTSCGCFALEQSKINGAKSKHNQSFSRQYHIWRGMKIRCYNPKAKDYKNYGGRGIKICDEWLNDFQTFYDWAMANGYRDDLTIDRINNDGNYEPSNCRWATPCEQANNRRKARIGDDT